MECLQCGEEFEADRKSRKFCSQSCAARFNRNRQGTGSSGERDNPCPVCGKPKNNYWTTCSHACRAEYAYTTYIKLWLSGEKSGSVRVAAGAKNKSSSKASVQVRRWLFETRECKCEKCGWDEVNPTTGLVPLHVHHIDGDGANNRPENLELLCPNCHSLTPTFGALNK